MYRQHRDFSLSPSWVDPLVLVKGVEKTPVYGLILMFTQGVPKLLFLQ